MFQVEAGVREAGPGEDGDAETLRHGKDMVEYCGGNIYVVRMVCGNRTDVDMLFGTVKAIRLQLT